MENKLKRETIELYHYRRIFGQEAFEKLLKKKRKAVKEFSKEYFFIDKCVSRLSPSSVGI